MPYRDLQKSLTDLKKQLEKEERLSPAAAELLEKNLKEIHNVLEAKAPIEDRELVTHLPELKKWLLDFSEEHPTLSKWAQQALHQANALGL